MDPYSGYLGTKDQVRAHMLANGRDPDDMIELFGPPMSVERVAHIVATHDKRRAQRKAQRASRKRNR